MKRIIILNTPEMPVAGTHLFHAKKLCEGFAWNGLDVVEINNISDLDGITLNDEDFVYISNHVINGTDDPMFSKSSPLVESLLYYLAQKKCIPIFWFWHPFINNEQMNILKGRYILTGEDFRLKPKSPPHIKAWEIQNKIRNYVPSTFSAAIHPDKIGTFNRSETSMSNFIGCSYKQEWLHSLLNRQGEKHHVKITPPFITEEERINTFLDSVTSLGFHSQANIDNSVVVERVFEGLAYGNVVISDNPCCKVMTDGIIEYVDSYESLIDLIHRAWYDKDYRRKKQIEGMNWCRNHGTYKPVALKFIEKAGEINAW